MRVVFRHPYTRCLTSLLTVLSLSHIFLLDSVKCEVIVVRNVVFNLYELVMMLFFCSSGCGRCW